MGNAAAGVIRGPTTEADRVWVWIHTEQKQNLGLQQGEPSCDPFEH
jgi:hypothetical protein